MITLAYNGTTANLGDRFEWTDEFAWSPVEQATAYSTTGALLVDIGLKQAGRPITLEGTATSAWISRALGDTLYAWAALPGQTFALTLRGMPRTVLFDHQRGGFEAKPAWRLADGEQTGDEVLIPTLRFLEV